MESEHDEKRPKENTKDKMELDFCQKIRILNINNNKLMGIKYTIKQIYGFCINKRII